MAGPWVARVETPDDVDAVRAVNAAAFDTDAEARLVDALRADPDAWVDGLSAVVEDAGVVVGHALVTRCRVGDEAACGCDENLLLDPARPVPSGTITYPPAFGV